jgi:chromosome segregation protein
VGALDRAERARTRVDAALEQLHDSDAQHAAVAERLAALGSTVRSASAEAERLRRSAVVAEQALASDRLALAELEQRLDAAQAGPQDGPAEPSTVDRDRLDAEAAAARTAETDARLALRTGEERARALAGRAEGLERAAREEVAARERAAARRERRRREGEVARAVQIGAAYVLSLLEASLAAAAVERDAAEAGRAARDAALADSRALVRTLEDELRTLTDTVHRDEVARTQQRLRIEALHTKALDELGVDPEVLITEYGPHRPVPASGLEAGAEVTPYVREEQEKRLRKAERALALLGRVNPLALEEFAALEERHRFLTEQAADLARSRTDLLDIVREVDQRVEQVFAAAFADTAAQFERVFARLFPGGEGRLVLTEPGDLLTTGIEIEARPPGKKVKRLSLLSGGERSLTAVAFLVAIFKARPSPFYVLDEVEAALDDTNLGRLLVILDELRESSQLIVVTHQKRTMEVADALYGVTMRGDGVTTVISQRLREAAVPA